MLERLGVYAPLPIRIFLALPFRTWLEPCAMLARALALARGGAGRVSLDHLMERRRAAR